MKDRNILARAAGLGVAACVGVLAAAVHAQSDNGPFEVVSDYATFEARLIGPKIADMADDANYFVIVPDGTIEGTWFGKEMIGAWRWEDGYFCRTLSAPRPAPEDCQEWAIGGETVRLVRDRGKGEETLYAIRD